MKITIRKLRQLISEAIKVVPDRENPTSRPDPIEYKGHMWHPTNFLFHKDGKEIWRFSDGTNVIDRTRDGSDWGL